MKYINSYKIFESIESKDATANGLVGYKLFESRFDDFKDIIDNLHQLCMDFKDDNLPVKILPDDDIGMKVRSMNIPTSDDRPFSITVYSDFTIGKSFFKFQKYLPNILSIIDYMKSEGYNTDIKIKDCYIEVNKKDYQSGIERSVLEISGEDFTKANDEGKYIPDISRGKLIQGSIIRLNEINSVNRIELKFDKIDKNYDI